MYLSRVVRQAPLGAGLRRAYSVLFMGTDDVAVPSLQALVAQSLTGGPPQSTPHTVTVATPSPRRLQSKGIRMVETPVHEAAQAAGLEVVHPPEVRQGTRRTALTDWPWLEERVQAKGLFDVMVVVSFGYFITPNVLAAARHGAVNVHPSLLPEFRGPAPLPAALLSGQAWTGVSVIALHPTQWDAGNILWQEGLPIGAEEDQASLRARAAHVGAHGLVQVLSRDLRGLGGGLRQADAPHSLPPSTAPKVPQTLGAWNPACGADTLHGIARAIGRSTGIRGAVRGTKHTLILRALQRHTDVPRRCDPCPSPVQPASVQPWSEAPVEERHPLPQVLQQVSLDPQHGTLAYHKSSKSLWVWAGDDWLRVSAAQTTSRSGLTMPQLANLLGLRGGLSLTAEGALQGAVASLG